MRALRRVALTTSASAVGGSRRAGDIDSHPHLPWTQTDSDDAYDRITMMIASDVDEGLSPFRENELSQPARHFLCRLVNRNLRRRVSPKVVPDTFLVMSGQRLPVLTSLQLVPDSLCACLWLQLAQVMSTNRRQRKCRGCGEWFDLKADKRKRSDQTTCSGSCRKRVFRARQERARQMRADGMSFKQISRVLGADENLVKEWVAQKRR